MIVKPIRVKHIMTTEVKILRPEKTLKDAVELFSKYNVSGAPVIDESKEEVVGVISESDIIRVVGRDNILNMKDLKNLETIKVKEVMSKPIVVTDEDTLEYAITLMNKNDINRLPVVDRNNRLVGLVARADIMKGMMELIFLGAMKKDMKNFGIVVEKKRK